MKTRFKMWYRLVGSAIEHAAKLVIDHIEPGTFEPDDPLRPQPIDLEQIFKQRDAEDEESSGLAEVLDILQRQWPTHFLANDVAKFMNTEKITLRNIDGTPVYDDFTNMPVTEDNIDGMNLMDFFYPNRPPKFRVSPKSLGSSLRSTATIRCHMANTS
jgi:hypothetical protein